MPLQSLIAAIPDMSTDANRSRNHFATKENENCTSVFFIQRPELASEIFVFLKTDPARVFGAS